ncbi:MAG: family 20 glycosylhydrolase [Acidobacteria bacterium]|nr:family 20 glycosylhydrolase [Acidobacteriota bacterium]
MHVAARFALTAALAALPFTAAAQTAFVNTLMPQPAEIHAGSGSGLPVNVDLTASVSPANSAPLHNAAERMMWRLSNASGVQFKMRIAESGDGFITIHVADTSTVRPYLKVDESYQLDVTEGHANIEAKTLMGAYDAMETLTQLMQPSDNGFVLPAVHVQDSPRFPWRGLLIDAGRHFIPVDSVLRTLDGMAAVKLNVLHWHLSENQGFRVESKRFPKLHELGSGGEYYTQAEIKQIIAYATARGIRVVPEFDLPGHSTSWLVAYPDLGSAPGPYKNEVVFGIHDEVLDPTRESTFTFLDEFFGEMAQLFPDEYMHIGGDESNGKQWRNNPKIAAYMKQHGYADTKALQAYFNKRLQAILHKHGKKMVGWDEILHPDLSPDVVVQTWHKVDFLINSAKQGHQAFFSQPWYLDHNYSAAQMYAADPIPASASLTEEQQKLILGGEACQWGEQVNADTLDSRIWPRAAAVAERLWSPAHLRDTDDMYRRLRVEELRLDGLGLHNISGPQRRQRQIAGTEKLPASFEAFVEALEPVDFGRRARLQKTSRDTPLTNLVDAVRMDPPLKHEFAVQMQTYLHSNDAAARTQAREQLKALFQSWVTLSPDLDRLAASRPQLKQIVVRRAEWPQLGQLGLDLIAAREGKHKLSADKIASANTLLTEADKPNEELVQYVVAAPMKELLASIQ